MQGQSIRRLFLAVSVYFTLGHSEATQGCQGTQGSQGFDVNLYSYSLNGLSGFSDCFFTTGYSSGNLQGTVSGVTDINFSNFTDTLSGIDTIYGSSANVSHFAMELTGYYLAPLTGSYKLDLYADDGASFQIGVESGLTCCGSNTEDSFINDTMIISRYYILSGANTTVQLTAGTYYPVRIVYYNRALLATLQLTVTLPNNTKQTTFDNVYQLSLSQCSLSTSLASTSSMITGSMKASVLSSPGSKPPLLPSALSLSSFTATIESSSAASSSRNESTLLQNTNTVPSRGSAKVLKSSTIQGISSQPNPLSVSTRSDTEEPSNFGSPHSTYMQSPLLSHSKAVSPKSHSAAESTFSSRPTWRLFWNTSDLHSAGQTADLISVSSVSRENPLSEQFSSVSAFTQISKSTSLPLESPSGVSESSKELSGQPSQFKLSSEVTHITEYPSPSIISSLVSSSTTSKLEGTHQDSGSFTPSSQFLILASSNHKPSLSSGAFTTSASAVFSRPSESFDRSTSLGKPNSQLDSLYFSRLSIESLVERSVTAETARVSSYETESGLSSQNSSRSYAYSDASSPSLIPESRPSSILILPTVTLFWLSSGSTFSSADANPNFPHSVASSQFSYLSRSLTTATTTSYSSSRISLSSRRSVTPSTSSISLGTDFSPDISAAPFTFSSSRSSGSLNNLEPVISRTSISLSPGTSSNLSKSITSNSDRPSSSFDEFSTVAPQSDRNFSSFSSDASLSLSSATTPGSSKSSAFLGNLSSVGSQSSRSSSTLNDLSSVSPQSSRFSRFPSSHSSEISSNLVGYVTSNSSGPSSSWENPRSTAFQSSRSSKSISLSPSKPSSSLKNVSSMVQSSRSFSLNLSSSISSSSHGSSGSSGNLSSEASQSSRPSSSLNNRSSVISPSSRSSWSLSFHSSNSSNLVRYVTSNSSGPSGSLKNTSSTAFKFSRSSKSINPSPSKPSSSLKNTSSMVQSSRSCSYFSSGTSLNLSSSISSSSRRSSGSFGNLSSEASQSSRPSGSLNNRSSVISPSNGSARSSSFLISGISFSLSSSTTSSSGKPSGSLVNLSSTGFQSSRVSSYISSRTSSNLAIYTNLRSSRPSSTLKNLSTTASQINRSPSALSSLRFSSSSVENIPIFSNHTTSYKLGDNPAPTGRSHLATQSWPGNGSFTFSLKSLNHTQNKGFTTLSTDSIVMTNSTMSTSKSGMTGQHTGQLSGKTNGAVKLGTTFGNLLACIVLHFVL